MPSFLRPTDSDLSFFRPALRPSDGSRDLSLHSMYKLRLCSRRLPGRRHPDFGNKGGGGPESVPGASANPRSYGAHRCAKTCRLHKVMKVNKLINVPLLIYIITFGQGPQLDPEGNGRYRPAGMLSRDEASLVYM